MSGQQFDDELFGELIHPIPASNPRKKNVSKNEQSLQKKIENILPLKNENTQVVAPKQIEELNNNYGSYESEKDNFISREITDCSSAFDSCFTKTKRLRLKVLSQQDSFECQACTNNCDQDKKCVVCLGKKTVDHNSSMLKFLQYIMQFKLHKKQSYKKVIKNQKLEKSLNDSGPIIRIKQTQVKSRNKYDIYSSFPVASNNGMKSSQTSKMSDTKSIASQNRLSFNDFKQKIRSLASVHINYHCNKCEVNPICGSRFHCQETQCDDDYDLCQQCYNKYGHHHQMIQIKSKDQDDKLKIYEDLLSKSNKYSAQYKIKNGRSRLTADPRKNRQKKNKNYLQVPDGKQVYVSSIH